MRPQGPIRSLAFAALVVVAALGGRRSIVEGTAVNLAWPAAGVAAFWMLLLRGRRPAWRDGALLAAVVAVVADLTTGGTLPVALALAAVNVGQEVLFAELYARRSTTRSGPLLVDMRDLVVLLIATGVATAVGALAGTGVLYLQTGSWSVLEAVVRQARNGAAVLVVVGLGLRGRQLIVVHRRRVDQLTAWVALRFDTGLTAVRTLAVAAAAVVFTLHGEGPFAAVDDVLVRALIVQAYVGLGAALALALAHNRDERLVLLDRVRVAADYSAERHRQVEVLARASRTVLLSEDPRTAVCQAVREAVGADGVYIIERDGAGHLVSTAADGLDLPPLRFSTDPTTSLTARLFTEGTPHFAPDAATETGISTGLVEHLGVVSAAWQPALLADDEVVAVIGVVWHQPVSDLWRPPVGCWPCWGTRRPAPSSAATTWRSWSARRTATSSPDWPTAAAGTRCRPWRCPAPSAAAYRSRCCCWTWTTSRPTTTRSGTPRATSCCTTSRRPPPRVCATET